ncbi:hypothetical protein ScPMuIL_018708 [Solemya velum]
MASDNLGVEYTFLGNSGLKVSNLCLGCMQFGKSKSKIHGAIFNNPRQLLEEASHEVMSKYAGLGGNFFDTADVYSFGESERILGKWLEANGRDKYVVASKVRFTTDQTDPNKEGLSRRHIMASIDRSLDNLKTNYLDLYQTHMWDPAVPIIETLRALNDLVRINKIRYFGCSNVKGWQLQKIVDTCKEIGMSPPISLQQQYSLLSRYSELEEFEVCANEGIGILPYSPLHNGLLTDKFKRGAQLAATDTRVGWLASFPNPFFQWDQYKDNDRYYHLIDVLSGIAKKNSRTIPQVSLRWLLQKQSVASVIVGATSVKQLEENMCAGKGWKLGDDEMEQLDEMTNVVVEYPHGRLNQSSANRIGSNPFLKH